MPRFVPVEDLFKGRHFDREIVVLCVRWYLSFKLSYRDLVAMMAERGIGMAHTTILRWVQHYTPEFEKRWKRFARSVGGSWRMDETYIRVKGEWVYLYRAVDKAGKTVDFHLSRKRDVNAAQAFLRKAMKSQRTPTKITLDAYAASHRAVAELKSNGELPKRVPVRTSKYLNNLIEQDYTDRSQTTASPDAGTGRVFPHGSGGDQWHRTGRRKSKKEQFQMSRLGGLYGNDAEDREVSGSVLASCPGCLTGTTLQSTGTRPIESGSRPNSHQSHFEERAKAVRPAIVRCPVQVPVGTLDQHRGGACAVRAIEADQRGESRRVLRG